MFIIQLKNYMSKAQVNNHKYYQYYKITQPQSTTLQPSFVLKYRIDLH